MGGRDFSGNPAVKNLSCNAGDMGSILGRGTKIPMPWGNQVHVPQLESLCAEAKTPCSQISKQINIF